MGGGGRRVKGRERVRDEERLAVSIYRVVGHIYWPASSACLLEISNT